MQGQRSSRGQWPLVQVFEKKCHFIHILWCIFMVLGHNDPWVESHMWPLQTWGQILSRGQWPLVVVVVFFFLKKGSLYPHTLMYFIGLSHNYPWVESHVWPQQTWGQRSPRGQWPSVHWTWT